MKKDFKLLKLPLNENLVQNRIDRFYEEIFNQGLSTEEIEDILHAIEHYIMNMGDGECDYFSNAAYRIAEARFWVGQG